MTPVASFELVLLLLGAALFLTRLADCVHLPPAIALVIGGMALALVPNVPAFDLDPDLIMVVFLPPLLLASAYFTIWSDFRRELRPILMLSVGAVAFTTFCVAAVAKLVAPGLPWAACVTLGAIVSPPDAVAAKAVLQRLALPRRLLTILEAESLINDASGLVLYRLAVAAALTGTFSASEAAGSFVWLSVGGVAIGLGCGWLFARVARRLVDGRLLIVLSLLMSWGVYILAERLHASGVLAVVAAGVVVGAAGHQVFAAHVRVQAEAVWEIVVFTLEALVFVLIGLSLRGVLHRMGGDADALMRNVPLALAVSAAVVASRFLWVFPATYLPRLVSRRIRERDPPPGPAIPVVISWAGMRGVVSLAAALALPVEFPGRDPLLLASFGVILFTVLIQGMTLGPLIVALKLEVPPDPYLEPLDTSAARVMVFEAAMHAVEALVAPGSDAPAHPKLLEDYRRRVRASSRFRDEREAIETERSDHFAAALMAVETSRTTLLALHRDRQIHTSTLRTLEGELDLEELRLKRLASTRA